ncbi:MAG: hypothetical protein ABJN62_07535 [Halioglobus sp.]
MSETITLDHRIFRFGFRCAVVVLLTGVIAMFLPLDVPEGYNAEHADRIAWLNANRGAFIGAWVNQIAAMLTLSGVFFCVAWQIRGKNPLRAILAGMTILLSVVAFIVPKFMAVWTIPLLAETAAAGGVGAEMSDTLLLLLNVTIPFSLYTSFDYLGFWLYGVFALLAAGPLFGESTGSKVAAVSLGLFGLFYQLAFLVLLAGGIAATEINEYFLGISGLLIISVIALLFEFRRAAAN